MREQDVTRFEASLDAPVGGNAPSQQLERATGAWSRESELAQFKQANR